MDYQNGIAIPIKIYYATSKLTLSWTLFEYFLHEYVVSIVDMHFFNAKKIAEKGEKE